MKKLLQSVFTCSILVLTSLFFSTCNRGNEITITSKNFQDVIEVQQNLSFVFSEDLIQDSLLNQWLTDAEYITFAPAVKGKYKWTSKNELTFSPDLKFEESTDYTAVFTDKLYQHASEKKILADEFKALSFHTAYLNISNINTFWAKNEIDRSINEVVNELSFNYAIDANQLNSLLEIKIANTPVKFDIKTKGTTQSILVAIQENGNYNDKSLEITIKPGLKCQSNTYQSKEPIHFQTTIPSKDNFRILQLESLYEEDKGYIQVTTNQEVGTTNIEQAIKIEPSVSFRTEKIASGFKITGAFVEKQSYTITIDKGLQGIFGGKLPSDFEQTVAFGPQEPYLNFTSKKGIYLSNAGAKSLGLKVINIPRIKVTIHKIYENNLTAFFRQNSYYFSSYQYEDYDDDYSYLDISDMGDVVYENTISSKSLSKDNGVSLLPLQFDNQNDFKGLYVVKVQSDNDRWINATKIVSFSDMGIIAKASKDQVLVFVNSILNATPIGDVKVTLVSSNNQQVYTETTNSEGIAVFENVSKKAPGFQVKMVTCQKNSDFNYLFFDHTEIETSRFDVGGVRDNPSGYDAYLYGDRDIYRPGETIHLNTIVRNEELKPLSKAPIKIKLTLPNGKEFVTKKGILNAEGAFATSIQLPASIVTGTYTAEVYTANDILLQSKYISIEEFLPDRIKINTTLSSTNLQLNQTLDVNAKAENFFGPPASDRKYEMELSLKRKYFAPKGFEKYGFNLTGAVQESFEKDLRQGTTNSDGDISESFEFISSYANNGVLDGKIYMTVFDESGRPVHAVKSFEVMTQQTLLGIKYSEEYISTKQNFPINLCAVNKAGQRLSGAKGKIQIIKYEWQTVIRNNYDGYRYVSERKQTILEEKIINFGAQDYIYNFFPSASGEYEVRLSLPDAKSYVSTSFYAYGYGTTNSSFEVNTDGNVDIVTDKEEYEVGDEAKLLFKTPFAGKILVTVERNKVIDHFYINTDHKSASLSIPIKKEYLPNAYITATLIKPNINQQIPLTVAHGFIPIKAKDKKHLIPVSIKAPARCRSNSKQTICISTSPEEDIEVTIAVVDEGILQLKNTKSPNPYDFFFRKKALEVSSYDIYPNLLPELGKSSMGGDGYDLEKRVNPLSNRRVNLMAYWSGQLKTNGSGEACYTIDIPSFSGDLRIMAVAYKGEAFGSAQANMKVADPLVVYTSLPRFLSPGDTILIPINITNTTAKSTEAQIKLNLSGPLKLIGNAITKATIGSNQESKTYYKAVATWSTGEVSVSTEVVALNETFKEQNYITVRPAASLVKISGSGSVGDNKSASFSIANNFLSGSTKGKLLISNSPLVQFNNRLDELIGYPHGCLEQTVSKAFPQLYVKDLIKNFKQGNRSEDNPDYNIQEAIRKLAGMQLNNGGISYWPGGYQENWWGTAYAAHFLYEAKRAGFQVDQNLLEKTYTYLSMKLKQKSTQDFYYFEASGNYRVKTIASKEIFYSLFVLAQAGHQDVSLMNYYKSNLNTLAVDSKYLLASTYHLLGDVVSFRNILPQGFDNEKSSNAFSGNFYSYIRDMAISLSTLMDTDANNTQVGILAKHLSEQLKNKRYLNTQEMAFGFIALGKVAKKANESKVTASIKANGQEVGTFTKDKLLLTKDVVGKNITIQTSGSGSLYYFWEAEGLPVNGEVIEEDSYLSIRKVFFDRNGNTINSLDFKQNDLIIVRLALSTKDQSTVNNVVITDILPAGFEIENPRVSEQSDVPWIKNAANPEHFDIRDDRINLYTSAEGKTKYYYYIVRAVSKGKFKMGPASADAMYNGEYHSYSGAGTINVE